MGELTDKLAAADGNITGKANELVGKSTENEQLRAEGDAQHLKGYSKSVAGKVTGALDTTSKPALFKLRRFSHRT